MKRAIIGGFTALIGSIWALACILTAANHLTSSWSTPPGRFLTTVAELGIAPYLVVSLALALLGMICMGIEYFKKDN